MPKKNPTITSTSQKPLSFYQHERAPATTTRTENDNSDKVLPASQPLQETKQTNNPDPPSSESNNGQTNSQSEIPAADNIVADTSSTADDPNCPICRIDVLEEVDSVRCDMCKVWSHRECLFMTVEEHRALSDLVPWYCVTCLSIQSNNIKWGSYVGEAAIKTALTDIQ